MVVFWATFQGLYPFINQSEMFVIVSKPVACRFLVYQTANVVLSFDDKTFILTQFPLKSFHRDID